MQSDSQESKAPSGEVPCFVEQVRSCHGPLNTLWTHLLRESCLATMQGHFAEVRSPKFHWNQNVGWIARGFPQQGFGPPASYYNIFFQLKAIFPYLIIYLIVSEFIWLYLNLFAVGPPWGYQAIHSNTSCDKQMCFKSFHPRSSAFDNTRKYDNSWQLGSNSAAGLGKVVARLR